ncbi:DUF2180 family protein [Streptomyces griseoviridis]|uniref:DUF2180 family protein n=2 Tax=Streptomyces TaxID=1883 RepID=A0A3S9ZNI1_STRGD|nr:MULTISPECIES: DUF2180 family protein [Streptomyces]AZS89446.1 DUF2180 family protein [Streptomyces griseoviridis]MDT0476649.1 DUF2180 family protein [Streptomyces sp. DSM 41014]QCN83712.1 hypothetical protein DDJ31_00985 [Streptomyces griseoviridis]
MKCYDCTQEVREGTVAIGVCNRCGLFTCQDHSDVVAVPVVRASGLGASHRRGPARSVVCRTCRGAGAAH